MLIFDAFSDDLGAEAVGERDGAGNDKHVPFLSRGISWCEKAAVELEVLDGELCEPACAGVSSTEVVESNADRERLDLFEDLAGVLEVTNGHRFEDLELEVGARTAAVCEELCDLVGEVVGEFVAGDVAGDGYPEEETLVVPLPASPERCFEDPGCDGGPKPCSSGSFNEAIRSEEAGGMVPAHERFHAAEHDQFVEGDLGLVVELELAGCDSFANAQLLGVCVINQSDHLLSRAPAPYSLMTVRHIWPASAICQCPRSANVQEAPMCKMLWCRHGGVHDDSDEPQLAVVALGGLFDDVFDLSGRLRAALRCVQVSCTSAVVRRHSRGPELRSFRCSLLKYSVPGHLARGSSLV